jgi:hypothetical protein
MKSLTLFTSICFCKIYCDVFVIPIMNYLTVSSRSLKSHVACNSAI